MAIKTSEELRRELTKFTAQKTGIESALNDSSLGEADRQELQSVLYETEKQIKSLQRDITTLDAKQKKTQRGNTWKAEQPLVDTAIKNNHIGYIINEDKFIYCRDFGSGQSNVQFKLINSSRIVRALNQMCGIVIEGRDHYELIDYFQQTGHSYLDVTSSFNRLKWNETDVYNKMSVIRQNWITPRDDGIPYHSDLDLLIHCVGGGKAENIEHLEKWVAFKYLHPAKNANTPNLDLGGNPGGNGKGTFTTMLKTIFTNTCVVQAHREELDKFNANWEMAVVLYYDEPEEKELAASKLKQATGAEDMRVEKKGLDATMADRNFNFVFMSNNQNGVVKLSGGSDGGEDRRYSVINTDLVLLDMYLDAGLDPIEAKKRLDNLQNIVKNPEEVGRWLSAKIKKYNIDQLDVLSALHGSDYRNRFEDQKDAVTEAFDDILPVFTQQGCLPLSVLCDVVKAHTSNLKLHDRNINKQWTQYLKRNKIDVDVQARVRYKTTWNGQEIRSLQGKVFNIPGSANVDFEFNVLVNKKPNYNSINNPIAKEDLVIG